MKTELLKVTKKESFLISFFPRDFFVPSKFATDYPVSPRMCPLVALSCILIIKFSYKLKQVS